MPSRKSSSCPNCGRPTSREDFQCAACELLLNPDAISEEVVTEPSVVRALLAPTERRPTHEIPKPPPVITAALGDEPLAITAPFELPDPERTVPQMIVGLEIAGRLNGLEAYVASFMDGSQTVTKIAAAARLTDIEVQAVVRSLRDRHILQLTTVKPAPVPPPVLVPTPKRPAPAPARQPPAPARPGWVVSRREAESRVKSEVPAPPPPPRAAPGIPRRATPLQQLAVSRVETEENALQRAIALERSGDVDGAIYILKRAIARVKNPAPLYNKLALVLVNQRKGYEEAEGLLRQAVELDPDSPVYQQNLMKVVALTAARSNTGKKHVGGFFARLTGRK